MPEYQGFVAALVLIWEMEKEVENPTEFCRVLQRDWMGRGVVWTALREAKRTCSIGEGLSNNIECENFAYIGR